MDDKNEFARTQIKAGRALLNFSHADLADALDMDRQKVARVENGTTRSGYIIREVQTGMEKLGIVFTNRGVELASNYYQIIEGSDCYAQLLDKILRMLPREEDKELLIMCASDKVSPPEINERYRNLRSLGVTMRQIVSSEDKYILGPLEEYRGLKPKYFANLVTVIFGNMVATVTGGEARILVQYDDERAERERKIFSYLWDNGIQPKETIAQESF